MVKKTPEIKKGAPAYMTTYADLATLLLSFFVLLFAMSTTDAKKYEGIVSSLKGSLGVLPGGKSIIDEKTVIKGINTAKGTEMKYKKMAENIGIKLQNIEKSMGKNISEEMLRQTEVKDTKRGVEITFGSAMLFESGTSEIKNAALKVLQNIAIQLKTFDNELIIEGHTDNVPINSRMFPSNWELSTARSTNVLRYMIEVEPKLIGHISAAGYADTIPKASNNSEKGKEINRRVQIVILKNIEERINEKNIAGGGN